VKAPHPRIWITPAFAVAAGVTLTVWLSLGPGRDLQARLPRGEEYWEGPKAARLTRVVELGEPEAGPGEPMDSTASWPQFRGPDRDGALQSTVPLATRWAQGKGPPVLWRQTVGEGHAGVAIHRGRVYLIDYDRETEQDTVRCLSLADGRDIWRYAYPVRVKRFHGMSRTVPAVTDDYVVTIGPKCHVHCLDAVTGKPRWVLDLVRDYDTTVPAWYAGQCALIDGDAAVLAPAGKVLMMAVALADGAVRWTTPNPGGWKMTHSSVMALDRPEGRQYLYCGSGGVAGVDAASGKLLWTWEEWTIRIANVATPVIVDPQRVFFSGGYNSGCLMAQVAGQREQTTLKTTFRLRARQFGAEQQTPILHEGHLYGVIPNGQVVCLALDGKRLWASGTKHRYGLGPYLLANGHLYVLQDQEGELAVIEARPDRFRLVGRAKILDGHDAWAPMALADGRLILRDLTQLICLDLQEPQP